MTRGVEQGRWDRIASVFDRVLEASDSDRPALLDQLCGSDETIRREVQDMLAAQMSDDGVWFGSRAWIVTAHRP